MMYQHMVDECLERAYAELKLHKQHGRGDYAKHVQARIDSLKRIRPHAPIANLAAPDEEVKEDRSIITLEQIMREMLR